MLEQHIRYREERGIAAATWEARGVQSIEPGEEQTLRDLGFREEYCRTPGFLLPLYNATGHNGRYQYHPDNPFIRDGKAVKYVNPTKQDRNEKEIVDVHPSATDYVNDPAVDLWITEGVAKADAATQRGLFAVAVTGVYNYVSKEWKFFALSGRDVYVCFDSDAMWKTDVHTALRRIGSYLEGCGATVRYVYLPGERGTKIGLDDFFAQGGTVEELRDCAAAELRPIESAVPAFAADDGGNGERFTHAHRDHARYDPLSGKWYIWCGTHWQMDTSDLAVRALARKTVRGILTEAANTADDTRRSLLNKWASKSASRERVSAMIFEAQGPCQIDRAVFNRDETLLNCLNGTVDLRDGSLRPHDPADFITRCCPTRYVSGARHPVWERYLNENGVSPAVRDFLLRAMGYSLRRKNEDEVFFFIYGPAGSGKGTWMEAVRHTIGKEEGYGDHINHDSFAGKGRKGGDTYNDFAGVSESRVLFTTEWPKETPLDASTIKSLTGGDPIKARFLFKEFFSFEPLFTPWFFGNFKPLIPTDDDGIWRRVLPVRFPVGRLRPEERDKRIKKTLCFEPAAREAVLASIVAGAVAYEGKGLAIPDEVLRDIQDFRDEGNPVAAWIEEHCTRGETLTYVAADARESFAAYQRRRGGAGEMSAKAFTTLILAAGFETRKREHGRVTVYLGIGPQTGGAGDTLSAGDSLSAISTLRAEKNNSIRVKEHLNCHPPLHVSPRPLTDQAEARAAVAAMTARGGPLALDIETTGLSPRADSVRLLQLSDGEAVLILDAKHLGDLRPFVPDNVELIGHNLAFEFGFLPPNRTHRAWDTMLASQVLNGGTYEKNDLASVAARHAGVTLDKAMQIADWSGDLTEEQIAYAARDVLHLHTIMDDQIAALSNEGLLPTAELEMRTLMAVQWMAGSGVALDWPRWEAVARAKTEAQGALLARLKEHAEINWQSNPQVLRYFVDKGCNIANTQEETLAALDDDVAQLLVEYRGYQKLTSTYGLNWAASLHEGRVHADWWQIETRTGRMSCKNPNLQNVPRSADYRSMFIAPDGRVLIKADYSQIELRIAAQMAQEPTMLAAYREGRDLHRLTASRVAGKPLAEVTKADRQMAKAVNFGFIYGMGATKFQSYAEGSYGVAMSGADAFNAREAFFSLYPKLRDWHSEQGGKWESPPIDTHTIGGRRRKEVKFFAERLNSPVQGTGGDGIKNALALLWEHPLADDIFPVLCVHDEIVVEAPAARAEEAKEWLVGHMVDGMAAYLTAVPVEVEATIARNWAGGE